MKVDVCGLDGCANVARAANPHLSSLVHWVELDLASMPPPSPYYEIRQGGEWIANEDAMFYVPSARVFRVGSNWLRLDPELDRRVRVAARGLEPWPWTGVASATVGGREMASPALLEQLFGRLPKAESPPLESKRLLVRLESSVMRPGHPFTPWTNGQVVIDWVPAHGVVYRDGEWFRVPAALQERLRQEAGLVASKPAAIRLASQPAAPVELVAGAVLAVALLLAGGLLLARRRLAA